MSYIVMKYNIKDYKNKIIRIISQKININYKEPYKLEDATRSIGSGFFIKDNYIITCSHCVENSKDIYIEVPDDGKRKFKVELIGLCPHLDIAVLKSNEYKSKTYFTLDNSDKIRPGNEVVAIGFPLGQDTIKITRGIISGRQNGKLQTDTPINPGNSGGPLIYKNKVIGIVSSYILKSHNVGYAIPINNYNIIKKELYDKKQMLILRTHMNTIINYNNTDKNILALYGAKNGIYIYNAAVQNILKKDDILVKINNFKIDSYGFINFAKLKEKIEINDLIDYIKEGDTIKLEYIRDKKLCKNSFVYKYNNYAIRKIYHRFEKIEYEVLDGLVITDLSLNYINIIAKDENEDLNKSLYQYIYNKNRIIPRIIISYIYPNTSISNLDVLSEGDIITKVNNIEVNTINDLRRAAVKYTIINNKKYILLETNLNTSVIIDVNEILKKSKNNRNTFKYPETPLFTILNKQN